MATKKQKRAAALAKRAAFEEEYRRSGLEAQRKDREHRARKLREEWRENHEKRHSWKKRIKECPICQDEIRAAKRAGQELSSEEIAESEDDTSLERDAAAS